MSKTELLAIILAVNGGLWLLLALIDWLVVRLTQYRAPVVKRRAKPRDPVREQVHPVPPAHAH